jgi:DNA-directed RNA polymerase II subunit RPB1
MAHIPYAELSSIGFFVLGSDDNKRDSHVTVTHQDLFRNGIPHPGGMYDAHMGTTAYEWDCATCRNDKKPCPGHSGDLQLNYPVLAPLFMKDIIKWLKVICFYCGKLIIKYVDLKVPPEKRLSEYVKLTRTNVKNLRCVHCDGIHPHVVKDKADNTTILIELYKVKSAASQTGAGKSELEGRMILYPHYIRAIFDLITPETVVELGKPVENHPRKFVLDVLRVPPNTIRPDVKKINSSRSNSNDLTILLQTIFKSNEQIPRNLPDEITPDLSVKIHNLSLAVYGLVRGTTSTTKRGLMSSSRKPLMSIIKRWPRKYGRIRRNLMGRRANHMGRSFITGDPYCKINEVFIPLTIARNIQQPVVVQEYNYNECMMYYMNGNQRYPGYTKIKKRRTGATHWLGHIRDDFRLEIGDIIHRDTIDGDIVGFNRQPTLLPSSISAMRCRVMEKGDTIRFNVITCTLFNADFDGDKHRVPNS